MPQPSEHDVLIEPTHRVPDGPAVGVSRHTGRGPVPVWSADFTARSAAHARRSDLWEWEHATAVSIPFADWPLEIIAERAQLYVDKAAEVRQLLTLELPAEWHEPLRFRIEAIEGVRRQLEELLRRRLVGQPTADVALPLASVGAPTRTSDSQPA